MSGIVQSVIQVRLMSETECDYCGDTTDLLTSRTIPIKHTNGERDILTVCATHTDSVLPQSLFRIEYDDDHERVIRGERTRDGEYPYGEWLYPTEFPKWMREIATLVEKIYNE